MVERKAQVWRERAEKAEARIKTLEQVVHDLLLSADCTWEERGEGHDWPEACEAARRALAGKEGNDG